MPSLAVDLSPDNSNVNTVGMHKWKACLFNPFLQLLKTFSSGLNKAEEAFDLVMFAHPEIIHMMPPNCTGNYNIHVFLKF